MSRMSKFMAAKRKTMMMKRRNDVMDMHLNGYTHEEIADKLGVSVTTVSNDIQFYRKELHRESLLDADEAFHRCLLRYERLYKEAVEGFENSKKPTVTTKTQSDFRRRPTTPTSQPGIEDGNDGMRRGRGRPKKSTLSSTSASTSSMHNVSSGGNRSSGPAARDRYDDELVECSRRTNTTSRSSAGDPRFLEIAERIVVSIAKMHGLYGREKDLNSNPIIMNWRELVIMNSDQQRELALDDPINDKIKRLIATSTSKSDEVSRDTLTVEGVVSPDTIVPINTRNDVMNDDGMVRGKQEILIPDEDMDME